MNLLTISLDDERVKYLRNKDKRLAFVFDAIGSITCSVHDNGFEFLAGEIVGQMLSNKVADIIENRLIELCNGQITPQTLEACSREELRGIGLAYSKADYLHNLASAVRSETLVLDELKELTDQEVMKKLCQVRGIGKWTAKMYLLFVLQRDDVLPVEDGAFLQAYKWLYKTEDVKPKSVMQKCQSWHPYASVASRYMYRALDSGLTKKNCIF